MCRPDDVTPLHGPLKMGQEHKDLIRDFAIRRVHEIAEWLNGHKEARDLLVAKGGRVVTATPKGCACVIA